MRTRFILLALAAAGIGLIAALRGTSPDQHIPVNRPTLPILDRRIENLDIDGLSLDAAIDQLSQRSRATILLDAKRDLESRAADGDPLALPPIHLHTSGRTLRQAIEMIGAAGFGGEDSLFAYDDQGVIRVVLQSRARFVGVPRTYEVGDFVSRFLTPSPGPRTFHENDGLFGGEGPDIDTPEMDELLRLIEHGIEPLSWATFGGGGVDRVRQAGGLLVLHSTPEVHQQVQNLLANLRAVRAAIDRGDPPSDAGIDLLAPPGAP